MRGYSGTRKGHMDPYLETQHNWKSGGANPREAFLIKFDSRLRAIPGLFWSQKSCFRPSLTACRPCFGVENDFTCVLVMGGKPSTKKIQLYEPNTRATVQDIWPEKPTPGNIPKPQEDFTIGKAVLNKELFLSPSTWENSLFARMPKDMRLLICKYYFFRGMTSFSPQASNLCSLLSCRNSIPEASILHEGQDHPNSTRPRQPSNCI